MTRDIGRRFLFWRACRRFGRLAPRTLSKSRVLESRKVSAACLVAHCPEHAKKSGGAGHAPSGMLACCQGLQSANFEVAKAKIAFNPVLVAIQLFAVRHLLLPEAPKSILRNTEYDTGPPESSSFVAIVLRRSLPENAPPLFS